MNQCRRRKQEKISQISRSRLRALLAVEPAPGSPGIGHPEEAVPQSFSREDLLAARLRVARVLPYQSASPPFISNLSLAICSGLLLVFAFPEWDLWSLGWVATAPLIMAVARERRFWRSLLLGTVCGTIFYAMSSSWVTYSMHNYGDLPLWLSYLILTVFASALGIFTGLFAGALGQAVRRFGGWAILSAPVLWAASEWARLEIVGVGWNALGYSQAFHPAAIQIARVGGVYMVSALMVAASAGLVFAVIYLERRRGLVVLTSVGVLAAASILYGQTMMNSPIREAEKKVSVAVVQPNVPIAGPWDDPKFVDQLTRRHIQLSEQAIESARARLSAEKGEAARNHDEQTGVDLVIWPESPMSFSYDRDSGLRARLADFTRSNRVFLLLNSWGYPADGASSAIFNSAMVIAPSGERVAQYDKIALVPFGEYVPARGWVPFMNRIPALVEDVTPGTSFTLSDVSGANLGTNICFEVTRPDIARGMRGRGASALVQISNESWFGPSSAPRQMLAHAVFRAVENDVELVRATNSGVSAYIDRHGAVEDETPLFETATRVWKVDTADQARLDGLTFYTRHGDLFAVTCAVLSLLLSAAALVPEDWKKKERDHD